MASPIRNNDVLLRLVKDVNDIRAALRRVVANLPLYDIANENTPATLSTNQNNYVPGNYDVLNLSSNASVNITGISGGVKGRSLTLHNVGSYNIIFKNESSLSLSANRFDMGYDVVIRPNDAITFYYNSTLLKWIVSSYDPRIATPVFSEHSTGSGVSVCWSPQLSLFCAVANGVGVNCIKTSPDGSIWTTRSAINKTWQSICWSPSLGLFCCVASASGTSSIMTSSNGTFWAGQTAPSTDSWSCVCWSPELGIFCAVGAGSVSYGSMTSNNGTAWSGSAQGAASYVCWSPSLMLFCSVGSGGIKTSPDGVNWTTLTNVPSNVWYSICWSAELGIFCAIGQGSSKIGISLISSDGTNWYAYRLPTDQTWAGISWSAELGLFFAVSSDGFVMVSPDGKKWEVCELTRYASWKSSCSSPDLSSECIMGSNYALTTP